MKDDKPVEGRPGKARQLILFVVLALVLGGLVYEYVAARPAFKAAQDKVVEISERSDASDVTDEEVKEILGFQPKSEELYGDKKDVKLERYAISRGIPMMSFDVWVWYKKFEDRSQKLEDGYAEKWYYTNFRSGEKPDEDTLVAKTTISINRNPGQVQLSGGTGQQDQPENEYEQPTGSGDKDADDKDADDKDADDKDADDKDADDKDADDKDSKEKETDADNKDAEEKSDDDAKESDDEKSEEGDKKDDDSKVEESEEKADEKESDDSKESDSKEEKKDDKKEEEGKEKADG